jgi:hypothetical protein
MQESRRDLPIIRTPPKNMASRDTQVSLTAAYQLMASYLVWDLRDLLAEGILQDRDARERLKQFVDMLRSAARAATPAYPASSEERVKSGQIRATRTRRLMSLSRDEEVFDLVIAARGDDDPTGAGKWAHMASSVLGHIEEQGWNKPMDEEQQRFIKDDVEDFLRRLQRVDQLDVYRPARRSHLKRR